MEISLDLRLPREATSVPVIRRMLDASLGVLGVDEPIRDDIQLMLSEACTNVIRHAGDGDVYTVRAAIVDDRCVIKVIDSGTGFDAGAVEEPVPQIAEHGRGIQIIRAVADDVRFDSSPDNGALVSLEKHLHYGRDTAGTRLSHHH